MTFQLRLERILKIFEEEKYFPFTESPIGIKSNGDLVLLANDEVFDNIFEKIEKGLVEYQNVQWGSYKMSNYDPYNMTIYKTERPRIKFLGIDLKSKVFATMSTNQDLNDYVLQSILDKKPIF